MDKTEHVKGLFDKHCIPTAIVDKRLTVVWANAAFKKKFPLAVKASSLYVLTASGEMEKIISTLEQNPNEPHTAPLWSGEGRLCFLPFDESCLLVQFGGGYNYSEIGVTRQMSANAAAVSRRFREPLFDGFAALSAATAQMGEKDSRAKGMLTAVNKSLMSMLRNTVLMTAYMEYSAGERRVFKDSLNLSALTKQIVGELAEAVKVVPIKLELPKEDIAIDGELKEVELLICELLSNAYRHCRVDGQVRVEVATVRDMAVVTVANSGDKLPKEVVSKAIEPFYSNTEPKNPYSQGMGLGLTVAGYIVNAHGGNIRLKSDAKETTVRFTLPLSATNRFIMYSGGDTELMKNRFSILRLVISEIMEYLQIDEE